MVDQDRARGALLGLATGDAIGRVVEFKWHGSFKPVRGMRGGKGTTFGLPAGAWTDDTSMALCLADSLIECGKFDHLDQLDRYCDWRDHGYRSSVGRCFDIGGATSRALSHHKAHPDDLYPGDASPSAGGNGVLMRFAPVAIAYAGNTAALDYYAIETHRTTHGRESVQATTHFARMLNAALHGEDPLDAALLRADVMDDRVLDAALRTDKPARAGGGAINALWGACWALRTTDSYKEAVLAATNLGGDTDTVAAITGQMAGALYGARSIPTAWRNKTFLADEIVALADTLNERSFA